MSYQINSLCFRAEPAKGKIRIWSFPLTHVLAMKRRLYPEPVQGKAGCIVLYFSSKIIIIESAKFESLDGLWSQLKAPSKKDGQIQAIEAKGLSIHEEAYTVDKTGPQTPPKQNRAGP